MPNTLPPHTGVILLAAGQGTRFGGDKLRARLGGRRVLDWSLTTFTALDPAALILVGADDAPLPGVIPAPGGATRRASVLNGLAALPPDIERVLIHDAARPGVSAEVILAVARALETHPAALPVVPLADTIRQNGTTLDRASLHAAQTPQGFHRHVLEACLGHGATAQTKGDSAAQTDEIQAVEAQGHPVAQTPGSPRNLKITQREDLPMLASLLSTPSQMRTVIGQGFDVHRFCSEAEMAQMPHRRLILGGLHVPDARPLAGHSDADVLLHALTDAIYGALGDGDIGAHFPDSDTTWKDQDSALFLHHALGRVAARGGAVVHADVTLICERPRLRPMEAAMRARLLTLLSMDDARSLGLKATTTEGLGFTGRGEGIAAQALVTVSLPG